MSGARRLLAAAGASQQLVHHFEAIAESTTPAMESRYADSALDQLERFIVGRAGSRTPGGGTNMDAAFYELCRFVAAVAATGASDDWREAFFLSPHRASADAFRSRIDRALAAVGGQWRHGQYKRAAEGVTAHHDDGTMWTIKFGRMPFLAALYEFLMHTDPEGDPDGWFFPELDAILDALVRDGGEGEAVRVATRALAAHMRGYRARHLQWFSKQGKFDRIRNYLEGGAEAGRVEVDDATILAFWCDVAGDPEIADFRQYKTALGDFVSYLRAAEMARDRVGVEHADTLGFRADKGAEGESRETDPGDDGLFGLGHFAAWEDPLDALTIREGEDAEDKPAAAINFLKGRNEREPIERLMELGHYAARLPLSLLRREVFGTIQNQIIGAAQFGRGDNYLAERIACRDAEAYGAKQAHYAGILAHVREAQKATLHAVWTAAGEDAGNRPPASPFDQARGEGEDELDADAVAAARAEAKRAFKSMTRKGFEGEALEDPGRARGFEAGAEALIAISGRLEAYLARLAAIDDGGPGLDGWFASDRGTFSQQFSTLYGVE